LKLLLDNHLSPRLAHCLEALFIDDHHVVALRDKFAANTTDVEWITALDQEGGWAVITRDLHIRTRPHERAALDKSNIVFFFLASARRKIPVEDTAVRLIRWIPKIATQTALAASGRFELPINPGSKLRPHRD
jgi:PIN like domain